jgi:hypothetical protein
MREATILIPTTNQEGEPTCPALLFNIEEEILCNFGGFTKQKVEGSWKDSSTGKIYPGNIIQYTIACKYGTLQAKNRTHFLLDALQTLVKHEYKQRTVYLRYPDGEVAIK